MKQISLSKRNKKIAKELVKKFPDTGKPDTGMQDLLTAIKNNKGENRTIVKPRL